MCLRAGRPVRPTIMATVESSAEIRVPAGTSSPSSAFQTANTIALLPGSKRIRAAMSVPRSRPNSSVTVEKTSAGEASRATSVATRRSAACSSTSRPRACSDSSTRRPARAAISVTSTAIRMKIPSTNTASPSRSRRWGLTRAANANAARPTVNASPTCTAGRPRYRRHHVVTPRASCLRWLIGDKSDLGS